MYPKTFFGEERFGLWDLSDSRVKADCTLVLAALEGYSGLGLEPRAQHAALGSILTWAADRCLYDLPHPWDNHDGAKGNPVYHWHTPGALEAWRNNGKRPPRANEFDHAVPRAAVKKELLNLHVQGQLKTWEHVRDYLQPRRAMAVLTASEHGLLNQHKLGAKMPPVGDEGFDPFARYKAVGIRLFPPLNRQ